MLDFHCLLEEVIKLMDQGNVVNIVYLEFNKVMALWCSRDAEMPIFQIADFENIFFKKKAIFAAYEALPPRHFNLLSIGLKSPHEGYHW